MVTVKIFNSNVNCDRYHLLRYGEYPTNTEIAHTETGDAFNGFESVIVNCNADVIENSRLAALNIDGFNNNNDLYFLITGITPITNNKTKIDIEYDVWMNKREVLRLGEKNFLYESSMLRNDYPFSDIEAREYYFVKTNELFSDQITEHNIIMVYHNSQNNADMIYWIKTPLSGFPFYNPQLLIIFGNLGIDTNNIVSIYLSPFPLFASNQWQSEYSSTDFVIQSIPYDGFIMLADGWKHENSYPLLATPVKRSVITDMLGAIVWTAPYSKNGTFKITAMPDISYSVMKWNCYVDTDTIENRFTIQCVDLGYFLDYYQQYTNLQKGYNAEIRQAQLEKQLYQNMGNMVSSGVNTGVMGSLGGSAKAGFAGGIAGSAISTAVDYVATADYNRKLEKIEDKQAKMQYDVISTNVLAFQPFFNGSTHPSIYTKIPDDASLNSAFNSLNGNYRRIRYNCKIKMTDIYDMIVNTKPVFISGDFDFIRISERDAMQLNARFKAGINFVNWTGAYGD